MDKNFFNIVLVGNVRDGFDRSVVSANLVALLKLPLEQAETLLNGKSLVVKRSVDAVTASKYKAAIERAGVYCSVDSVMPDPPLEFELITNEQINSKSNLPPPINALPSVDSHHNSVLEIFVNNNGVQQGPLSLQEIQLMVDNQKVDVKSTMAWHQGLPEWVSVVEIPGIKIPSIIKKSQDALPPRPSPLFNESELHNEIDGLSISEGKKILFKLIASTPLKSAVGVPVFDSDDKRLKPFRASLTEKDCIWNGWAFLFTWFYWCAKGMWKKGIVLGLIQILTLTILEVMFGSKTQLPVGISFMVISSAMANYDLYRKLVLKQDFWW